MNKKPYIGRFSPSPTGPLHFGSLVAAVSSYAQAHTHQGQWLVRIEDVDLLRCDSTSTKLILNALEAYGMYWDEDIIYQSQRNNAYQSALDILRTKSLSYDCACSRKDINENTTSSDTTLIYPGTCKNGVAEGKTARSIRLHTNDTEISFNDALQGYFKQILSKQVGDFIIKRTDGLFAYQLAVVVDDAEQKITDIVRGSDMLDSTPRQIFLQQCLNYSTPNYMHTPLAANPDGSKLSKQNKAPAIDVDDPRPTLLKALDFLGQRPPSELRECNIDTIWEWVIHHWAAKAIPAQRSIAYNESHE